MAPATATPPPHHCRSVSSSPNSHTEASETTIGWSCTTPEDTALVPVLPLTMEKDGLRLSLFTVIATFGTAQDVTADELRIETLFPADEATERLLRQAAADPLTPGA